MITKEDLIKQTFNIGKAINLFIEQNNRMTTPLKTDFEFLKWLDEGRLVVIGGGSGLGKTAFVLQMLYELVRDNQDRNDKVIGIYASAEMTIEELTMRLIVNQQVIENVNMLNIRKIFNARITNEKTLKENIAKAKIILSDIPFYFLNASRFNLKDIIDMIKLAREKNKDKRIFIVIDYLQLLLLDVDNLQEMNKVIKELKDCLVEYKANAIVVSALNREATKNDRIDMSAFKDSSMIEYTSDIAILFAFKKRINEKKTIYTLKIDEENKHKNEIEMYAYCVKNRIGKYFDTKLIFNKEKQRFIINPPYSIKYEKENNIEEEKTETPISSEEETTLFNEEFDEETLKLMDEIPPS